MVRQGAGGEEGRRHAWTFLSNHAHVLVCLARDPDIRLRDVADQVGITERATFKIVGELEQTGAVRRIREGRRNHYELDTKVHLRHPLEAHCDVAALLRMILTPQEVKRVGLGKSKR